jgi:hypothetical protein
MPGECLEINQNDLPPNSYLLIIIIFPSHLMIAPLVETVSLNNVIISVFLNLYSLSDVSYRNSENVFDINNCSYFSGLHHDYWDGMCLLRS